MQQPLPTDYILSHYGGTAIFFGCRKSTGHANPFKIDILYVGKIFANDVKSQGSLLFTQRCLETFAALQEW